MARNLADIIPAVFTGPGGTTLTPEQIAQRQALAQSLIGRASDTRPDAGGWASVLNKALMGGMAGYDLRTADKAETANGEWNAAQSGELGSLLAGTPSVSSSPVASAATSGVSAEMTATSPAPVIADGEIADYIRQSASARGIDPEIAIRVAMSEGGVKDPTRQSGIVKNGVREPSYGPFQLYMGGGLGNKALEAGIDPRDPNQWRQGVDFALDQAAKGGWSPWYGAAKVGVGARTGLDGARAIGYAAPAQAAPAVAAIEAAAPASGYVDQMVSAPNYVPPEAEPYFDQGRFGGASPVASPVASLLAGGQPEIYSAQSDFAPELPAPVNVAAPPAVAAVPQQAAAPTQVAQPPQAQQSNTAAIAQALRVMGDPRASDGTRRVAQALLQQEQQKQSAAQEQAIWQQRQDYERQQQNSDPLRLAQIAKLQRETATGGETFFGNPIATQNPDGTIAYGQIGNQGTFRPIQLPQGQSFAPPTRTVDTGTESILMDQAGNVISRTPKQNKEAASQTAEGSAEGKGRAETTSEYNSITSKMPGLYSVVDRLSELADKATYTMAGQALDFGRSQIGMDPREAAVARAEYTATIDNQILPLLKDTFGAQFTDAEGLRLAATLGDANKTPTEKQALLKAFIEQKERDIEALRIRTGQPASQQSVAPKSGSRLKFNPQTGELE